MRETKIIEMDLKNYEVVYWEHFAIDNDVINGVEKKLPECCVSWSFCT